MVGFIDDQRGKHGVEPICRVLPIAPSTYYDHLAKRADPARLSDRARRDAVLRPEIERVFEENWRVYGVRKVWRQLDREGFDVARCTVARLMKGMGIQGIIRGKPHRTTIPDKKSPCPLDKLNRQFRVPAPNMLWVSDFTYVATWRGFVYVAFIIDAYARRIVGWRASQTAHAGFVLDALEQAVHDRRPIKGAGLVHHSDRGSQYLSIRYTERLGEAGIELTLPPDPGLGVIVLPERGIPHEQTTPPSFHRRVQGAGRRAAFRAGRHADQRRARARRDAVADQGMAARTRRRRLG
ncbi:integrase catalytic subunit [Rhodovulum sulfidophilum]|uniref:Integrase catalytic subunit n=1 Tax=Rhodovulum sulfidophilum TaxID=35806 RepID=A0A0D6B354_RHOSU|nr:integrase catalytic subunit [Rhodovulum sulfidophilum]